MKRMDDKLSACQRDQIGRFLAQSGPLLSAFLLAQVWVSFSFVLGPIWATLCSYEKGPKGRYIFGHFLRKIVWSRYLTEHLTIVEDSEHSSASLARFVKVPLRRRTS